MTVSVVQTTVSSDLGDYATFGSGVTKGNSLVIADGVFDSSGTITEPGAPTLGGTALSGAGLSVAQFKSGVFSGVNDVVAHQIWVYNSVTAAQAGATAVQFAESPNSGPVKLWALEVSTGGAGLTLDKSPAALAPGGASSSFASGSTGTTITPVELAVAILAIYGADYTSGVSSPWTQLGDDDFGVLWYQVTSATASLSISGSLSASANWTAGVVTLFASAAAGRPIKAVPPAALVRSAVY